MNSPDRSAEEAPNLRAGLAAWAILGEKTKFFLPTLKKQGGMINSKGEQGSGITEDARGRCELGAWPGRWVYGCPMLWPPVTAITPGAAPHVHTEWRCCVWAMGPWEMSVSDLPGLVIKHRSFCLPSQSLELPCCEVPHVCDSWCFTHVANCWGLLPTVSHPEVGPSAPVTHFRGCSLGQLLGGPYGLEGPQVGTTGEVGSEFLTQRNSERRNDGRCFKPPHWVICFAVIDNSCSCISLCFMTNT